MKSGVSYVWVWILVTSSVQCVCAGPVPDTGQKVCYSDTGPIQCPGPGERFHGQDAQYNGPQPSFTKLDAEGNDLPDSASSWSMVRDDNTGIIWEVKTEDGSIHDRENIFISCSGANGTTAYGFETCRQGPDTDDFIAILNARRFGGHSDWRLPDIKELSCLVNAGTYDPSITTDFFPGTVPGAYWSDTISADNDLYGWRVYFSDGYAYRLYKSDNCHARAVRCGETGAPCGLTDNNDGTVTDKGTGLTWQQLFAGPMTWEEALSYCEGLEIGGFDDWRLPNRNELQSIIDYEKSSPAANEIFFPGTLSHGYWTSTTYALRPTLSWVVDFHYGYVIKGRKAESYYVRAVRGGQADLLVDIQGQVSFEGGPVCAMVLANGSHMFTCDGSGDFRLRVPLDAGGKIVFYAFCEGLAPYELVLKSCERDLRVQMVTAGPGDDMFDVSYAVGLPQGAPDRSRIRINGTVSHDGVPLCAMILVNGEYCFTCGENPGVFDLNVPVDANGEITLYGFCEGFQPYKDTITF